MDIVKFILALILSTGYTFYIVALGNTVLHDRSGKNEKAVASMLLIFSMVIQAYIWFRG